MLRQGLTMLAASFALAVSVRAEEAASAGESTPLKWIEALAVPTPQTDSAVQDPPAVSRRRKRIELSLTSSLSAWSGTRRLDDAAAVAVPRIATELVWPLPAGFNVSTSADVIGEQVSEARLSRARTALREVVLGYRQGAIAVRAGVQIINWGRTDVVNPTDNLSARDYTRMVERDADQTLGVPSASLIYRIGQTSIQTVWQPLFRASTIPLPAISGLSYREQRPSKGIDSGGLRIDTSGEQLSWSVSYFCGPAKRVNLDATPSGMAEGYLDLNHPRQAVWGGDFEAILGKWALRGEGAYSHFDGSGSNPISSRESYVESVLGLERSFGTASAFLQTDIRHVYDYLNPYQQPAALSALALANASINEELHPTAMTIGGGGALNTADLRWSIALDMAYAPGAGDIVIRPRIRYRLSDLITVWGGADYFDGPPEGIYGRLRKNTVAFVGLSTTTAKRW